MTPQDQDAYVGMPDLYTPKYDKINISVTFTWDLVKVNELIWAWSKHGEVSVGGCAYDDPGCIFLPGMYIKSGVVITSRGCNNKCDFCFVPKREGKIRELSIAEGNVIQDNNLLATSEQHRNRVFSMLSKQRQIDFPGGFEASRVSDKIVEQLRGLKIYQMWLAYDHPNAEKPLKKATDRLSKYFKRDKIRCYVLIGYPYDTIEKAEQRLRQAWEIGTLPFAMLFRNVDGDTRSKEWRRFQRLWTRPAIIKSRMR